MLNHDIIAAPPAGLTKTGVARPLPTDRLEWAINLARATRAKTIFLALFGLLQMAFGLAYPALLRWADQHHLINPDPSVMRPSGVWLMVILVTLGGAYLCLQALVLGYQARHQIAALEQIKQTKANPYATAGATRNE